MRSNFRDGMLYPNPPIPVHRKKISSSRQNRYPYTRPIGIRALPLRRCISRFKAASMSENVAARYVASANALSLLHRSLRQHGERGEGGSSFIRGKWPGINKRSHLPEHSPRAGLLIGSHKNKKINMERLQNMTGDPSLLVENPIGRNPPPLPPSPPLSAGRQRGFDGRPISFNQSVSNRRSSLSTLDIGESSRFDSARVVDRVTTADRA